MSAEQKSARGNWWLAALGLAVAVYAVIMPGSSQCRVFGFVQTFHQATWGEYLEWVPMRGNLRLILFCLGLWLLVDGVGLWLLRSRRNLLGTLVFLLYAPLLLGLATAAFFLLKSVL
jgi:cytochrome c-type biogenesis protein CcmH/NrfF